jgi:pimeloyl-ACP methyl ester carboxylesterase
MSKTVMLIHGAWLTPLSWEHFRARYEAAGYTVHAPAWPHEDIPLEQLRRSPPPELRKLTVGQVVDHYDDLIRALREPPIIVGHSYGGLFTQLLLDRGLGTAGVAIDSVPVAGVLPRPRVLLSALPVFLSIGAWNRVLTMSFGAFAANFANGLPADKRRAAYDRYVAPTPGRLYYQAASGIGLSITANNPRRAPLLLIAGERDRTITPSQVGATFRKQRLAPSISEMKVFPDRSHFLCLEPGWEEVADYALDWAALNQRAGAATA